MAIQFQYAFVSDDEGLKVFSLLDPDHPVPVPGAFVRLAEANRLYAARTYVYVANGKEGLAIIDIERPEHPHLYQMYNAEGRLNDVRAVQIGSVSASMFALVADGRNGMRVIQLISPENVPENAGFSPRPNPVLIATAPLKSGEAIAVGRGLDRDRVVDETGAQTVVFGRRGSRPFSLAEMSPFLRHLGGADLNNPKAMHNGAVYRVSDVVMSKDANGVQTLHTTTGESLAAPSLFTDPSAPAATPGATPANGPLPSLPPPNGFMSPTDVQRLLETTDPNRPPDVGPLPPGSAPAPSPTPGDTYLQPDNLNRLLRSRAPAGPAPTPLPTASP